MNLAGVSAKGRSEPRGTRVQALGISPERTIIVEWPTASCRLEGRSSVYSLASSCAATGVLDRSMYSKGLPRNLGEPLVSLETRLRWSRAQIHRAFTAGVGHERAEESEHEDKPNQGSGERAQKAKRTATDKR